MGYLNSQNETFLPLSPWEKHSLKERKCNPVDVDRDSFPTHCCIGSASKGGGVGWTPGVCNYTEYVYQQAEAHALEFLSHHPIIPMTDGISFTATAVACDACQIVNHLLQNNWTLAFQGDSVANQSFDALECELRRHGYQISKYMKKWKRSPNLFWRRGISEVHHMHVLPPPLNSTHLARDPTTEDSAAHIRLYKMYRPLEKNDTEIMHIVSKNDVIVFDHGLHWTSDQQPSFLDEMTDLIRWFFQSNKNIDSDKQQLTGDAANTPISRNKPKLLAWRETISQHFNTPDGNYQTWARRASRGCVPFRPGSNVTALSWYQELMLKAAEAANVSVVGFPPGDPTATGVGPNPDNRDELAILPFTLFTRPLHYLHPGGEDCSHICYTPFVWLPVWRTLRISLDRAVLRHAPRMATVVPAQVSTNIPTAEAPTNPTTTASTSAVVPSSLTTSSFRQAPSLVAYAWVFILGLFFVVLAALAKRKDSKGMPTKREVVSITAVILVGTLAAIGPKGIENSSM